MRSAATQESGMAFSAHRNPTGFPLWTCMSGYDARQARK